MKKGHVRRRFFKGGVELLFVLYMATKGDTYTSTMALGFGSGSGANGFYTFHLHHV